MNGITQAFWQIITLFGPLIACVGLLQALELRIQKRMSRYFGWQSNLWTGWIGAPVHEYSHAIVAWIFGHQVDRIVPFQPEAKTGRLGYVIIRYNAKSTWQTMGHFFVCYAPLAGGTLAIFFVTLLFYPSSIQTQFQVEPAELFKTSLTQASQQLTSILTPENVGSIRFWAYSYLVLAIGCHLAPSSQDYQKSARGHRRMFWVGLIVFTLFLLTGGLPNALLSPVATGFLMLQANFIFAVFLCSLAGLTIYIITELMTWLS
jgi:hypothetical protein